MATSCRAGRDVDVAVAGPRRVGRARRRRSWRRRSCRSRTCRPAWSGSPSVFVVRLPARVYSSDDGRLDVYGDADGGVPVPTRKKPSPWIARSSGLPVDWSEPAAHQVVDRAELDAESDLHGVGAAEAGGRPDAPRWSCGQRVGERDARRLVADRVDVGEVVGRHVEHRLVCFEAADRGDTWPRIIGTSLPFAASSERSGRGCLPPRRSCDHGTVDVGEHVLAHVLGVPPP